MFATQPLLSKAWILVQEAQSRLCKTHTFLFNYIHGAVNDVVEFQAVVIIDETVQIQGTVHPLHDLNHTRQLSTQRRKHWKIHIESTGDFSQAFKASYTLKDIAINFKLPPTTSQEMETPERHLMGKKCGTLSPTTATHRTMVLELRSQQGGEKLLKKKLVLNFCGLFHDPSVHNTLSVLTPRPFPEKPTI